ncbi:MAG TPA: hypothetical protein VF424_02300 [Vicinamibacterales bacterium]
MELASIATRALASYLFLLALLRLAGNRFVRQGTTFDFVLALILGDLIDDAIWSEVPMAQFVVAAGTLLLLKLLATTHKLDTAGR